jgi:hypothetical protein
MAQPDRMKLRPAAIVNFVNIFRSFDWFLLVHSMGTEYYT